MIKRALGSCGVGLALAACASSPSTGGATTPDQGSAGSPGVLVGTIDDGHVLIDVATRQVTPLGLDGWHMTWGPFQDHRTMLVEGDDAGGAAPTLIVHATGAEAPPAPAGLLALSPDGAWGYLSTCTSAPTACLVPLVDGQAGTPTVVLAADVGIPIAWTRDGEVVFDAVGEEVDDPNVVTIVKVADGSTVRSFQLATHDTVEASADGTWIVWNDVAGDAVLAAPITDPEHPRSFSLPAPSGATCVFAKGDTRLVCSQSAGHETDDDRTLRSIDVATGSSLTLTDHAYTTDPVVSPDGNAVAWSEVVNGEERVATSPVDRADVQLLLPDRAGKQLVSGWIR